MKLKQIKLLQKNRNKKWEIKKKKWSWNINNQNSQTIIFKRGEKTKKRSISNKLDHHYRQKREFWQREHDDAFNNMAK
jgi:DNA polymerase III psi subunit